MRLAFTIAAGFVLFGGCSKPHQSQVHPRDIELVHRFATNRSELEHIVAIFRSCPDIEILDDKGFRSREKPRITCDIPLPDHAEHTTLLHRLGVKRVFKRADENIGFLVSEEGWTTCPGSMKGYE